MENQAKADCSCGMAPQLWRHTEKIYFGLGAAFAVICSAVNPFDPVSMAKIWQGAVQLLQFLNHQPVALPMVLGGIFLTSVGSAWRKTLAGNPPKPAKHLGDKRSSGSALMGFFLVLAIISLLQCDVRLLLISALMVFGTGCVIYQTGSLLDEIAKQTESADGKRELQQQKANCLTIIGILAIGLGLIVLPKIAHAAPNAEPVKHTVVAISATTATYGFTYSYDSAQSARLGAYLSCQGKNYPSNDCVVFTDMTQPGLYALAIGDGNHAAVVGGKKTAEEAQQAAVEACSRQTKGCAWKHWWQHGEIKP